MQPLAAYRSPLSADWKPGTDAESRLKWHCAGSPKNHQIFCKHCVALALASLSVGVILSCPLALCGYRRRSHGRAAGYGFA